MDDIVVLIPSYNPSDILIEYVKKLKQNGFNNILVVNDGSDDSKIFDSLKKFNFCTVLTHTMNLGKGAALKTGFRYYNRYLSSKFKGIITVDDDEQHSIEDCKKLVEFFDKDSLILGVRNFNLKTVPFRSKLGNKFTSSMFKLVYKKKISDTQTGLRIYPNIVLEQIDYLDGYKFDYETNVLIYCIRKKINILEIGIDTIYIDNNRKSRFKTFQDSKKIARIFWKNRHNYK